MQENKFRRRSIPRDIDTLAAIVAAGSLCVNAQAIQGAMAGLLGGRDGPSRPSGKITFMVKAENIFAGSEYFHCRKYHCDMSLHACVKRQKLNYRFGRLQKIHIWDPGCLDCSQGQENLEKVLQAAKMSQGELE